MANLNSQDYQIKLKQGLAANINATATKNAAVEGEPHWTTDTGELYVYYGSGSVNKRVGVALDYGTFTPTGTNASNLDATPTGTFVQYMRVGTVVTVSGRFTADPTLTATSTSFEMTLPIPSNIGAERDVAGVAFCGSITGQGAEIKGVVANDTAKVQWVSTDVTSQDWSFTFTYRII